jgi:MerR family copper efflux transcriptional regulator
MVDEKSLIRVGELASRTDKTVRALRLYEEIGLLKPAERTASGYRMYDNANIERIKYIGCLQGLGLSLNDIADLVQEWEAEETPRQAMEHVRDVYSDRLQSVRQKMVELKALESDLIAGIGYLRGCSGCLHEENTGNECVTCVGDERSDEVTPNLIIGLLAH